MAHIHYKLSLLCIALLFSLRLAVAQAVPLENRLQQLPPSFGENRIVHMEHGEDWVALGIREHVGYEQLNRANPNGFINKPSFLLPGRHIAEGYERDGLVLNLPELMLYRWQDGHVVAWYPISIGMITERWNTPLGRLNVISREVNPVWHEPEWAGGGEVAPGGSNPLGNRWIGLSRPGYGIHGTNNPTTIGRTVSHGCIRMFPPHVDELFEHVWIGMPVDFVYQTIEIGQENGVVYMAVFPDIYSRGTNQLARARERLATFGLDGVLSDAELTTWLAHDDGVARPLLGSPR